MSDGPLFTALEALKQSSDKHWVVALSGGLDSTALVHACAHFLKGTTKRLRAVHIDHGLQSLSSQWATFCVKTCQDLNLDCVVYQATTKPHKNQSIEDWARTQRYQIFAEDLKSDELLLTAHTVDDQAETFIMQSLRGAGAKGLSSMGAMGQKGSLLIARPWLSVSRQQLTEFAQSNQLNWVDDPSNDQTHFQRNYIRHRILSKLVDLQPGAKQSLATCAAIAQENQQLLEELAQLDLDKVLQPNGGLSETELFKLSNIRQKNLIRYWLSLNECPPMPRGRLDTLLKQFEAKQDANPVIDWQDISLRRYRKHWFIVKTCDHHYQIPWSGEAKLSLPNGAKIKFNNTHDMNSRDMFQSGKFLLKPLSGISRIRSQDHNCSKPLKKWWQQFGIEPWNRVWWPGLFYNDELISIPGMFAVQHDQAIDNKINCDLILER